MSDREQPQPSDRNDRQPVLPRLTRDETGEAWGERRDEDGGEDERYLRERPPHHGG
ncbi:MAG: hypothetical protein ACR2KO_13130 [Geodermatophilaceae bacterium]|nr:hypothetical protein [Geodermatophilaceae bacterium]